MMSKGVRDMRFEENIKYARRIRSFFEDLSTEPEGATMTMKIVIPAMIDVANMLEANLTRLKEGKISRSGKKAL